jgi:hypothetical protein
LATLNCGTVRNIVPVGPLKIIEILDVQLCSLLKTVVLKWQLQILFVTSKIVLRASKKFCCVSVSLSEGFSIALAFFATEAK